MEKYYYKGKLLEIGNYVTINDLVVCITHKFLIDNKHLFDVRREMYLKCVSVNSSSSNFTKEKVYFGLLLPNGFLEIPENDSQSKTNFVNDWNYNYLVIPDYTQFVEISKEEYILRKAKEKYPPGTRIKNKYGEFTIATKPFLKESSKYWLEGIYYLASNKKDILAMVENTSMGCYLLEDEKYSEILHPLKTVKNFHLYSNKVYVFIEDGKIMTSSGETIDKMGIPERFIFLTTEDARNFIDITNMFIEGRFYKTENSNIFKIESKEDLSFSWDKGIVYYKDFPVYKNGKKCVSLINAIELHDAIVEFMPSIPVYLVNTKTLEITPKLTVISPSFDYKEAFFSLRNAEKYVNEICGKILKELSEEILDYDEKLEKGSIRIFFQKLSEKLDPGFVPECRKSKFFIYKDDQGEIKIREHSSVKYDLVYFASQTSAMKAMRIFEEYLDYVV